jgi:hypothetical protein
MRVMKIQIIEQVSINTGGRLGKAIWLSHYFGVLSLKMTTMFVI